MFMFFQCYVTNIINKQTLNFITNKYNILMKEHLIIRFAAVRCLVNEMSKTENEII